MESIIQGYKSNIKQPKYSIKRQISINDTRKDSITKLLTNAEMLDLMDAPRYPSTTTDDFKVIKDNGKLRFCNAG